MTPCSVDDCGNEAKKAGLCWAHHKRKVRRRPLNTQIQEHPKTPWQSLLKAIDNFSEAAAETPEEDAMKAWKRIQGTLRKALDRYNARMRARRQRRAG